MSVPLGQMCERGICMQKATVENKVRGYSEYICSECDRKDKERQITKIVVDPHHCSREEYGDLITYLEDKSWDYKFIKEGE